MTFDDKIRHAIKLLQSIPQDGPIELSYSGGKDSDVILELAKMSEIPFEAIYKNTTIDPPGTIKHCRENGVTVIHPKQTMFQIIENAGMPTRWHRFCCSSLKEYKIHDRAIQGIRRSESTRRAARYKEPEYCRAYSAKEKARIYLPILYWTNDDIERFIEERGIKCHPLYYDEEGNFHAERRLGCIGCPLAGMNSRRSQFLQYPKMLRAFIYHTSIYLRDHPNSSVNRNFKSVYDKFYCDLFYDKRSRYLNDIECDLFPVNAKDYLENYFGIEL